MECYHTPYRIYQDPESEERDLLQYYFDVPDEQSLADHTVKLSGWDGGEEDFVQTKRVNFGMGYSQVICLSIAIKGSRTLIIDSV